MTLLIQQNVFHQGFTGHVYFALQCDIRSRKPYAVSEDSFSIEPDSLFDGSTCEPVTDLTDREKHIRRIEAIKARAALCRRQESQRRGRPRSTFKPKELMNPPEDLAEDSEEDTTDYFPLICRPTQCPFCLGEERKSYEDRTFEYCRPNKMMEHVQKAHLRKYASNDEINCEHPTCKANSLTLPSVMAFKSHTAKVHQITLRA
jgi:hypothetical protein